MRAPRPSVSQAIPPILRARVNLAVGPGELVIVHGPRGAGKSLLLAVAAARRPPGEGQVWISSRKVASLAELETALPEIRAERHTSVLVIATDPATSTSAGGAWWDVAVPEISERAEIMAARAGYDAARTRQRVSG